MPTITVPAALVSLATIRDYIEREVPTDFRNQTSNVLLVAEELLVNVFSYAYPAGYAGSAQVDLALVQDDGEEKLLFITLRLLISIVIMCRNWMFWCIIRVLKKYRKEEYIVLKKLVKLNVMVTSHGTNS